MRAWDRPSENASAQSGPRCPQRRTDQWLRVLRVSAYPGTSLWAKGRRRVAVSRLAMPGRSARPVPGRWPRAGTSNSRACLSLEDQGLVGLICRWKTFPSTTSVSGTETSDRLSEHRGQAGLAEDVEKPGHRHSPHRRPEGLARGEAKPDGEQRDRPEGKQVQASEQREERRRDLPLLDEEAGNRSAAPPAAARSSRP